VTTVDPAALAAWNLANLRARHAYYRDPAAASRLGGPERISGYLALLNNGRTPKQAREWARANGHDVSANGRVSAHVIDDYLEAIHEGVTP
jgi:hypothetical protein